MQTIKMRIFNPHSGKMLYDLENVFECLMQQIAFDKSMPSRGFTIPYDHRSDGMVWMQSMQIKDFKGTDLFEGDIILDCRTTNVYLLKPGRTHHGWTGWYVESSKGEQFAINADSDSDRNSQIAVLGNIHEQKELFIQKGNNE